MAEKAKEKTESKSKKADPATPKKAAKKKGASKNRANAVRACKSDGCKLKYRAKGFCRKHYKKWRRGELGKTRYRACTQNDCFRPMSENRHGYCEEHYIQRYVKKIAPAPVEAPAEETAAAAEAG